MDRPIVIDFILVPQGAEYQAVCKGLAQVGQPSPQVVPIPMGIQPVMRYLQNWQQTVPGLKSAKTVLVMGLCGSLNPAYRVGDAVLYEYSKDAQQNSWQGDRFLNERIQSRLPVSLVRALSSDRLLASAQEKQALAQAYGTDVVDMEGTAIFKALEGLNLSIAMLRVVSDNCLHDLPDLNSAIDGKGSLRPLPIALGMMRQPIAATRLIRGSLKGLQALQTITTTLWFPRLV